MPTTVHHPIFARFYARLAQASDSMLARHRTELLAPALGRVVEVGAGSGSNFARYPTTVESVLALEPEPYLRDAAEVAAGHASMPIEVRDAVAEELPVETGSVDAVVFSLVLCSIGDVATALSEARRVLRPGGSVLFYEHVVAPTRRLAAVQRGVDHVWPRLFGGCHAARDTVTALEAAGFEDLTFRRLHLDVAHMPTPVSPHVLGRAVSPGR